MSTGCLLNIRPPFFCNLGAEMGGSYSVVQPAPIPTSNWGTSKTDTFIGTRGRALDEEKTLIYYKIGDDGNSGFSTKCHLKKLFHLEKWDTVFTITKIRIP